MLVTYDKRFLILDALCHNHECCAVSKKIKRSEECSHMKLVQSRFFENFKYLNLIFYSRGLETTVRGPDAAHKAISSGPQSHFDND